MPVPDFARLLRPGGRVLLGQGAAEPRALVRALLAAPPPFDLPLFIGPGWSDSWDGDLPGTLHPEAYGAIGSAAKLARAGRLDLYPLHLSALNRLMGSADLPVDVIFLQVRPALSGAGWNLGLSRDFVWNAVGRARQVVLEVNENLPAVPGGDVGEIAHAALLHSDLPAVTMAVPAISERDAAVAAHVASVIPDGAVIQVGIGTIPAAVLAALRHHRDLGFHSGAAPEGLMDLMEAGVITNARKTRDRGVSVAGNLIGSERLYRFAHANPAFRLAGTEETHDAATLAAIPNLHAINSALEVDLTGQVGAEFSGGRYLGAVGGQVDFTRGARASEGGRAIIALPSVTPKGQSRIVLRAQGVTTARSDADLIITEHGVADLRGASLRERAKRMIAIAAPEHREALERGFAETAGM